MYIESLRVSRILNHIGDGLRPQLRMRLQMANAIIVDFPVHETINVVDCDFLNTTLCVIIRALHVVRGQSRLLIDF